VDRAARRAEGIGVVGGGRARPVRLRGRLPLRLPGRSAMSVNVGQMVTEVVPEPEPQVAAGTSQEGGGGWSRADREREDAERRRRIALRTRAEGFDD
jgi:hypothetical protein